MDKETMKELKKQIGKHARITMKGNFTYHGILRDVDTEKIVLYHRDHGLTIVAFSEIKTLSFKPEAYQ